MGASRNANIPRLPKFPFPARDQLKHQKGKFSLHTGGKCSIGATSSKLLSGCRSCYCYHPATTVGNRWLSCSASNENYRHCGYYTLPNAELVSPDASAFFLLFLSIKARYFKQDAEAVIDRIYATLRLGDPNYSPFRRHSRELPQDDRKI